MCLKNTAYTNTQIEPYFELWKSTQWNLTTQNSHTPNLHSSFSRVRHFWERESTASWCSRLSSSSLACNSLSLSLITLLWLAAVTHYHHINGRMHMAMDTPHIHFSPGHWVACGVLSLQKCNHSLARRKEKKKEKKKISPKLPSSGCGGL